MAQHSGGTDPRTLQQLLRGSFVSGALQARAVPVHPARAPARGLPLRPRLLVMIPDRQRPAPAAGVFPEADGLLPEGCQRLEAALLDAYLGCGGEWAAAGPGCSEGSPQLAQVLLEARGLAAQRQATAAPQLPDQSQSALRLAVLGPPQAGKSGAARHLAQQLGLPLLCPRTLAEQVAQQQEQQEQREQGEAGRLLCWRLPGY